MPCAEKFVPWHVIVPALLPHSVSPENIRDVRPWGQVEPGCFMLTKASSWHITTVGPLHIAVDLNQWAIGSVYLVVARGRWWEAVENLLTRSVLRRVASWWIQLLTNSQKIVHEFLFKQWVMLTTQRGAQCPQHSTSYQQIPTVKQVAMLERHHHWCLWHLLLISTGANKQSVVFYSINTCASICVIVNSCMCTCIITCVMYLISLNRSLNCSWVCPRPSQLGLP